MDNKQKFIYTMDKSIAEKLISDGYTLLLENNVGNMSYVFMNNGKLTFDSDEDKKKVLTKIAYTNVLCV